jgi:hypothetical protein
MPFGDYEDFDACVRENSDKRDPEAYCGTIKRQIEGAAALSEAEQEAIRAADGFSDRLLQDDPCWDGYTMVGTKVEDGEVVPNCVPDDEVPDANLAAADDRCGEGAVKIGDRCVQIDSVDAPPSILSQPRVLAHRELAGAIERVEQSDGSVRYTDIKILSEGVWTDQSSKQPTHYDPANLEVAEDNTVNIAHDEGNEVSAVGRIDAQSAYVEDGDLYADVVLHMENAASEYADENLTQTLETGGQKGFGGPSVEIPPEGLEISDRGELGYPKTEAGVIDGLGLVKNPASRPTSFDIQTANRQVALCSGNSQSGKALVLEQAGMSPDELREILDNYGFEGLDEMSDEDVMEVAGDLHEDLMGELQPEDDEEGSEMGDYGGEDDDDEEDDRDMMDDEAIDVLNEQIDDLWDAIDEMKEQMATSEEMSDELEAAREELAAADTVAELQEAKEELDRRLSEVESEPTEGRTLADDDGTASELEYVDADGGYDYDPGTGSAGR